MRIYHETGNARCLSFATYFIHERGRSPLYFEQERQKYQRPMLWKESTFQYQYYQAGKPVVEQDKAEGHAVRAMYLYSGMVDVAEATGDATLFAACERLWNNVTQRQMYITGAVGAQHYGESFSFDYNLPNDLVYGETCASIGLVFFARRMFLATHDAKYVNVMEQVLYNSVLSGIGLNGKEFFYVNPLEVVPEAFDKLQILKESEYRRQKWFGCACCPPNLARLLASIGEYAYAVDGGTFFVNLYLGGDIKANVNGIQTVFHVESEYPWTGDIRITVHPEHDGEFSCAIRIPSWSERYQISLNGSAYTGSMEKGYLTMTRIWRDGDVVDLRLPLNARLVDANPQVRADHGKVAVMRGPVVFCLEECDNGKDLHLIQLKQKPAIVESYEKDLLGGVVVLSAEGQRFEGTGWNGDALYQNHREPVYHDTLLTFVPYYAWANRTPGEMLVWVPIQE